MKTARSDEDVGVVLHPLTETGHGGGGEMRIEINLERPIGTAPSGDENATDTILPAKTGEIEKNPTQGPAVGPHARSALLDPTAVNDLADPNPHITGHPIHTEHRVNGTEGLEITMVNLLASTGSLQLNHL